MAGEERLHDVSLLTTSRLFMPQRVISDHVHATPHNNTVAAATSAAATSAPSPLHKKETGAVPC